ncbi:hypothetical protein [Shouchella lonarensis]|uniref:ABC transporter periplasmic binding protein yphF n=1 Tax=Shouchella lonarensis TaxID=1464122 RepID=A0A1G6J1C7_9BACI|nr:hypothetical protein [Shouchella lonarensis]SDC12624.1 hypothetical protein SAMN05421737_105227 [Shouchella lonarensis]
MKDRLKLVFASLCIVLFSGCFFPNEQRVENQITYPDQLASVQTAIEQFQVDNGGLPIRTFDESVPMYHRYVIDFSQLVPRYMQTPPGTAFENGGTHQYVLVNVEDDPQVKVIDLTSVKVIRELQERVRDYRRAHTYAPVEETLDQGLFTLDFEALGYEEAPYVQSPYHETIRLPLLYTNEGNVVIDYKMDLTMYMQDAAEIPEEGIDLRPLLYEESPYAPAHSVPYSLDKEGEIIYDRGLE